MNTNFNIFARKIALPIVMLAITTLLAGCERAGQGADNVRENTTAGQPAGPEEALGQVMEFEGYTLRASISRADVLSADMARQYGIDSDPDLALLNLVIQDNQVAQQSATVEAEVTVQYLSVLGQPQRVDMKAVEADGYISYIGTLDASSQRVFTLTIKAQPAGKDQLLEMDFEVQLHW